MKAGTVQTRPKLTIATNTAVCLAVLLSLFGGLLASAAAQDNTSPREITVGYLTIRPFVTVGPDGELGGMAVELWQAIEDNLGYDSSYVEYGNVARMLEATAAGDIDIAIGAISITEERTQSVDFTQPWFDSGLRILIDNHSTSAIGNIWSGLADAGHLRFYGWLIGFILAGTIGLTLFDRHFDKAFPRRWREGLSESFYAVMLVATKGTLPSRSKLFGWYGKIFAAFWLVVGIAVVAYVTSSVTSVMTTIAIQGDITGPDDLPGHSVGVLEGSTAQSLADRMNYDYTAYANMDDAVSALSSNAVDAVVGDAPVLEYYKAQNDDGGLDVVGRLFAKEKFGFALPYADNSLIFPVTVELLALQETGFVKELSQKYFGDER